MLADTKPIPTENLRSANSKLNGLTGEYFANMDFGGFQRFFNSIGNLGGFFGPYIVGFLDKKTGSFCSEIIYLSCSAFIAAILILLVKHFNKISEN